MNTATQPNQFPPKHPQFILAADKSFFEDFRFGQNKDQRLGEGITRVEAISFYQGIAGHTVLRRRYELDLATTTLPYRQYLPYDVFGRMNRQFKREYFAYRRTPQAGESELHGKVSVGIGGHIDGHRTFFSEVGALDLFNTVAGSALAERVEELKVYKKQGPETLELTGGEKAQQLAMWAKPNPNVNILVDNGDNVGQRHFAIVNFINVPEEYELDIAEEELEALGFLTYDELTSKNADGSAKYNLEGWTKICLEYFEKGASGKTGVQADMTDIQRGLQAQQLSSATKQDQQAAIEARRERADKIRTGSYDGEGEAIGRDQIEQQAHAMGVDSHTALTDNPNVGEDGVVKPYVDVQDAGVATRTVPASNNVPVGDNRAVTAAQVIQGDTGATKQFEEAVSTPIPATGELGANPENQPGGAGSLTLEGHGEEVDTGQGQSNEPHGGWLNHQQAGQVADALTASNTEDFKDGVNTLLPSTGDLVPDPAHQPGGSGSLTLHNEDADKATSNMPGQINTEANKSDTPQTGLPVQDPLVDNDPNKELITDPSTIPTSDKPAE